MASNISNIKTGLYNGNIDGTIMTEIDSSPKNAGYSKSITLSDPGVYILIAACGGNINNIAASSSGTSIYNAQIGASWNRLRISISYVIVSSSSIDVTVSPGGWIGANGGGQLCKIIRIY